MRFAEAARFSSRSPPRAEAERLLADTTRNDLFQANKCAAANEQDVRGIDWREFLVRMLATTLRRNVGDRAFQNLQQSLLHAFAGDIAGDRRVFVLAADLVDLIYIDDARLGAAHIAFGGLKSLRMMFSTSSPT